MQSLLQNIEHYPDLAFNNIVKSPKYDKKVKESVTLADMTLIKCLPTLADGIDYSKLLFQVISKLVFAFKDNNFTALYRGEFKKSMVS